MAARKSVGADLSLRNSYMSLGRLDNKEPTIMSYQPSFSVYQLPIMHNGCFFMQAVQNEYFVCQLFKKHVIMK